ncbi:MAG TPA: hypothetical protein PKA64_16925 [Myxococcota bacterium]|nr:hypothetical protein [Myxococcota bacterium]
MLLLGLLLACGDAWKAPLEERYVLVCRYQAVCAESAAGLDCDAYADQLVVRPDPCLTYDDYYVEPCLEQLRDLVDRVEHDAGDCGDGVDVEAPACTQAYVEADGGRCGPG